MILLWHNFEIILGQEISLYRNLLEILINQRQYISSGSFEGIEETAKEGNTLILKLKVISEARLKLFNKISQNYMLNYSGITLSQLIELSDEPYLSQLKNHFKSLHEIVEKLERINRSNYMFFSHSLQYIQNAIGLLINKNTEYTEKAVLNFDPALAAGCVDAKF
ncbi:flagellar protein FlgN [Candidatus Desantisbacteria bacterium]|nr:flagellar protein FlgN [Candidatus Desantisbacteria bacterium]